MNASELRRGLSVDGRRITRTLPTVANRRAYVRVYFDDNTSVLYLAGAVVPVTGYREPLPAGRVSDKPRPAMRKVKVSDGRWAGEQGGYHVDFISRTTMYDMPR